jgi:hypothetical protein
MMGKFGISPIFALCSGMSGVCMLHAVVHYVHTQGFHKVLCNFLAKARGLLCLLVLGAVTLLNGRTRSSVAAATGSRSLSGSGTRVGANPV